MEHLLEAHEAAVVGAAATEERGHVGLPALVDVRLRHRALGGLEVVGLQIADQQPVSDIKLPDLAAPLVEYVLAFFLSGIDLFWSGAATRKTTYSGRVLSSTEPRWWRTC